jgi:hypothetical protein
MFKLDSSVYLDGLESDACLRLSSLQNIATITPPITVAAMRSQLETGQIQPFTDAGFDQYLGWLYSLNVDNASLTAGERTILQNIREYLEPSPSLACCGVDNPTIGNSGLNVYPRVGSATFENELQVSYEPTVTCDIATTDVTITPTGGAPAASVSPVTCNLLGCVDGFFVFSKLFIDFVGDPSGFTYDFTIDAKDSGGVTIGSTYILSYTFP